MRRRNKRNRLLSFLRGALAPAAAVIVLIAFFTGIGNVSRGSGQEGTRRLEESIRRAVVSCYAAEGIYPPSVDYMVENYGLQVDESRYIIDYEAEGSNLTPVFTVIERSGEGPSAAGDEGGDAL